ncbi:MAG TPA: hypothetical protein VNX21_06495 [Candidatus Thermoplasmatota archaeon]|nr:hypothetical protein [Candidatus Thermoplasmatota archaeon]
MPLRQAVVARLRDPWFRIALALTFLAPLAALVYLVVERGELAGVPPHFMLVHMGSSAIGLLPMLVFFMAASAPEAATRRQLLTDHAADLAMLAAAFALGWGVPALGVLLFLGATPMTALALGVYLVEVALLLAAWRAVAAVVDRPGLDAGQLHRRLFLAWLLLAVLLPFVSQAGYASAFRAAGFPPWVLLADALSPESAFTALAGTTFPGAVVLVPSDGPAWHSPWTYGLLLLAWAVLPLLLALRRRPAEAPPAEPPQDAGAQA